MKKRKLYLEQRVEVLEEFVRMITPMFDYVLTHLRDTSRKKATEHDERRKEIIREQQKPLRPVRRKSKR